MSERAVSVLGPHWARLGAPVLQRAWDGGNLGLGWQDCLVLLLFCFFCLLVL